MEMTKKQWLYCLNASIKMKMVCLLTNMYADISSVTIISFVILMKNPNALISATVANTMVMQTVIRINSNP